MRPTLLAREAAPTYVEPLTDRERDVATLVAKGLSNRDIANELCISEHTARSHVSHILIKLGFESRLQLALWVREDRLRNDAADR